MVIQTHPNDTVGNLRINEELSMRVSTVINGATIIDDNFSPPTIIKVKPSSEVGDVSK